MGSKQGSPVRCQSIHASLASGHAVNGLYWLRLKARACVIDDLGVVRLTFFALHFPLALLTARMLTRVELLASVDVMKRSLYKYFTTDTRTAFSLT